MDGTDIVPYEMGEAEQDIAFLQQRGAMTADGIREALRRIAARLDKAGDRETKLLKMQVARLERTIAEMSHSTARSMAVLVGTLAPAKEADFTDFIDEEE